MVLLAVVLTVWIVDGSAVVGLTVQLVAALVIDGSACGWSDSCTGNHCCSTGSLYCCICCCITLTSSCIVVVCCMCIGLWSYMHCFVVVILLT